MNTKILAIANQKGGVGKTTTCVNLAMALSKLGHKVCVVDFDSQVSATNCLNVGLDENNYNGIYEMMIYTLREVSEEENPELAHITSFEELCDLCICRPTYTVREVQKINGEKKVVDVKKEFGFDLIPSKILLSDYELEISNLSNARDRALNPFRLKNVLDKVCEIRNYDFCLIDCNPTLGLMNLMPTVAACASEGGGGSLIPTNLDLLSTRGAETLIDRVADVQELLKERNLPYNGIIGVVLNLFREGRTIDMTIKDDMEKFYPIKIFESKIPESVIAKKAVYSGVTYSMMSKKADEAYIELAKNIITRIDEMKKEGPIIQRLEPNDNRKKGSGVIEQ